ncbi:hypothetical protein [Rhizobium bangladeshense]|uniref:hypothetical protein n=1 Tax=Rhizobium bangladeshense TaxID=1138189 RepID=UPI001A98428D|nr:hypothetical protein [Rhizobium bangladeshense]MBX4895446.1 hypothetical protein [Rhizobium bangladeshense]QSY96166.1 hypothetical protein J2J97_09800 [Rhizobium bangladeshense]
MQSSLTLRQLNFTFFWEALQTFDLAAVISDIIAAGISVIFLRKIEFAACGIESA